MVGVGFEGVELGGWKSRGGDEGMKGLQRERRGLVGELKKMKELFVEKRGVD